jgi:murein DD-endopeptidase MepM/ murein hydrolase activator NlpD
MPPTTTQDSQDYVVQPHDNLTKIAQKFHTTPAALSAENQLGNPDQLKVGQQLRVPKTKPSNKFPTHYKPLTPAAPAPAAPAAAPASDSWFEKSQVGAVTLMSELLDKIKKISNDTAVQLKKKYNLTPQAKTPAKSAAPPAKTAKKVKVSQQAWKDRLGKVPQIVTFEGVTLDHNERLKIVASISACEGNFASVNADAEFVGRANGHKGIETGYSRVVHIGLSWGLIQFTQDGGALGDVLKRMYKKAPAKFTDGFGNNFQELLTLTSTGLPGLPADVPLSGQAYWQTIKKKPEGKKLKAEGRAGTLPESDEIRGKRVQPIAITVGGDKKDLWTDEWKDRFHAAGSVLEFQEAQLEIAIENYMNPALPFCATNKIKSAFAIAFVAACQIRGASAHHITDAAESLGLKVPFESTDDEIAALKAIANKTFTGTAKRPVDKDEARRAKLLLSDPLGFLAEDYYAVKTYTQANDK